MKNYLIKFAIAALTFIIGVSAASLSLVYSALSPCDGGKSSLSKEALPLINSPVKNSSNKIEVRFIKFVENGDEVSAEFEVTNNTEETAYYVSYEKGAYPFPERKRDGKILQHNKFRCGTGLLEHALVSGETVIYRVPQYELTNDWSKESWKEMKKPTQIGFPLSVGKEKRKEIVWSEEISFHKAVKR